MTPRAVLAVLLAFLAVGSAAFAVDATAGQEPDPVAFDDTVEMGMTQLDLVTAREAGYAIPRAQAFYSGYPYAVGYNGIESLVEELAREGHERQFGLPLSIYVTDYANTDVRLTDGGYLDLPGGTPTGWIDAETAHFVVDSAARTPAGPAVVAFSDRPVAEAFATAHGGRVVEWDTLRDVAFGGRTATRETMRTAVEERDAWADRTVAATRPLLDRPVSVVVGVDAPTLQAAVDAAPPNTTVRLPAGTFEAADVPVEKPLTIRGAGNATRLVGDRNGSVLVVSAPRVAVADLHVSGVGDRHSARPGENATGPEWDSRVELAYGHADAGIEFEEAEGSLVAGVAVETPANGVVFRDSPGSVVRDSTVRGDTPWREGFMDVLAMRSRVVVQDVTLVGGRDGVYTHRADGLVVRDSYVENVRFGVHEMYTSDALLRNNTVRDTQIGVVVMTWPEGNAAVGNDVRGSRAGVSMAGSDAYVAENVLVGNRYGLYVGAQASLYERNVVADNEVGARASTILPTNVVTGNDFVGNDRFAVSTLGPLRVWTFRGRGNYWAGAPGGDRDGDGVLDRPFHPTDPVDGRVTRAAGASTLAASPAVTTLRGLQDAVPALRPSGVVDAAPLAEPVRPKVVERATGNATTVGGTTPAADAATGTESETNAAPGGEDG